MTDVFDEDTGEFRKRTLTNTQVMAFIARYWRRRKLLFAATATIMLIAICFELMIPGAAKQLVDAASKGTANAPTVWRAWAVLGGVYLAYAGIRNFAFRFWNPLAARTMQEMTDEAFQRVQSFSADWHADHFAGATVRQITRAMWGYDTVADAVVLWISPALIILVGLSVQMMLRWPLVGAFSLAMVALYVASNVLFSNFYVRKANMKSVALDSGIGAALADSIASNPTVRAFGAEPREESRFAGATGRWRDATMITWNRYLDTWLVHNLMLAALQAGLTGLMVLRWSRGQANAGDVAFVITSFLIMTGYMRNIGDNIRMAQKALADVEDVARFATIDPQVADIADAPLFTGESGEIVFDKVTFRYKSAETPIYDGFSLRIAPGERLALVGPTGSGKSTFVKLVQRLYDVQGGRVVIDGQDVAEVAQGSLRRGIAVVPQDPALFHRTIAENIAYARPDATPDEVMLAAKRARAHDFSAACPRATRPWSASGG